MKTNMCNQVVGYVFKGHISTICFEVWPYSVYGRFNALKKVGFLLFFHGLRMLQIYNNRETPNPASAIEFRRKISEQTFHQGSDFRRSL
jgi:hypothetical protein